MAFNFDNPRRNSNCNVLFSLCVMKKYVKCLKLVQEFIKTDGEFWFYYKIYGICLTEIGKPEDALTQFEIGWNLDPSSEMMRFLYANQLWMLKDYDKSAKIHRGFFNNSYQLKVLDRESLSVLTICVQFAEAFIFKIINYQAKFTSHSNQLYTDFLIQNIKYKHSLSKKKRVKCSQIAKTVLNQGLQYIDKNNYAFDFCYLTRRLALVDMIDMKWKGFYSKYLEISRFHAETIPEDYDVFYLIPMILKKVRPASRFLLKWIKQPFVDDDKLLTIYCHLILLYCDNRQINKCEKFIKKGKKLCLNLRDTDFAKQSYGQSGVFYFHWVYAYYLTVNRNIDEELSSDALFIVFMQQDARYMTNFRWKMCFYFGKYWHYTKQHFHLAKFFYRISILRMKKFNEKEVVCYNYAKLLYQMGKYKTSLKYWEKSKNLLFFREDNMEYMQFKNLITSKQMEYACSIYCSWCKVKRIESDDFLKKCKCKRCKSVFYCSERCQKKHWKQSHRLKCKATITANSYLEKWMIAKFDRLCICKPAPDGNIEFNKWLIHPTEFNVVSLLKKNGSFPKHHDLGFCKLFNNKPE
eukprot:324526_1